MKINNERTLAHAPNRPDMSGFDEVFKHMSAEDGEEADQLLLRHLELVVLIANEAGANSQSSSADSDSLAA